MTFKTTELIPQMTRNSPAIQPGEGFRPATAPVENVEYTPFEVVPSESDFPSLPALVGRSGLVAGYWTAVLVAAAAMSAVFVLTWIVSVLSKASADTARAGMSGLMSAARDNAPKVVRPRCPGNPDTSGHVNVDTFVNVRGNVRVNVRTYVNVNQ